MSVVVEDYLVLLFSFQIRFRQFLFVCVFGFGMLQLGLVNTEWLGDHFRLIAQGSLGSKVVSS